MRLVHAVIGLICISGELAAQAVPASRAAMMRYRQEFVASCVPKVATAGEGAVPAKSLCGCMADKVLVENLKAHRGDASLTLIVMGSPRADKLKSACLVDFSAKGLGR